METNIPFEIHLTVDNLPIQRERNFLDCCARHAAKPLRIALARGSHLMQPMATKVVFAEGLPQALEAAQTLALGLNQVGFSVVRTKIEVPAQHAAQFSIQDTHGYFEWHARIELHDIGPLTVLCEAHGAHLSRNDLHGDPLRRFVTIREYGNEAHFHTRIHDLTTALRAGGWPIQKHQSEYCIYDSQVTLDDGWLTTINHNRPIPNP